MPRYEFFCRNCKKLFSTVLSLVDYEEGEVLCPHCGSQDIEQCWSAFSAITSKKSADTRARRLHQSWPIDTPGEPT
jgi:putative FmdB family regulatory protein